MIRQPAIGTAPYEELDEARIRAAVRSALAAHGAGEAELHASEIVYVEDDTADYGIYREAADLLARRHLESERDTIG